MNIVSGQQWSGWFKGIGSAGVVVQNVLLVVMPILLGAIAIAYVWHVIKASIALSKAEDEEQRKEAKIKLVHLVVGIIFTLVGPTIVLVLMQTIGKTVQTTTGGGGATPNPKQNPGLPGIYQYKEILFTIHNPYLLLV